MQTFLNTGDIGVRVDIDVDFDRHRPFLRHLVPVPPADENDHLLDHHLHHLAGGTVRHPALRHFRRHSNYLERHVLRGELV